MIDLITPVFHFIEDAGNTLTDQAVSLAKANAPHDTGQLAGSIDSHHPGKFRWVIDTHANGWNGVAYPARIEAGDPVYPRRYGAVYFHGSWHLFADASKQSHFMEKTMGQLHI